MSRFLGEIRQLGYVVHDIEAAMDHWSRVLGVGQPLDILRLRKRPEQAPLPILHRGHRVGKIQTASDDRPGEVFDRHSLPLRHFF